MPEDHECTACSVGCEGRRTPESDAEEIASGWYLLFCAGLMIGFGLVARWLFG